MRATPADGTTARSPLEAVRGFAFDLDGTIWVGPRLLPGAVELVADLRKTGTPVIFASNASRYGAAILARTLTDMGIPAIERDVVTAFDLAGEEIRRRLGRVRVMPLGTSELGELMEASGHEVVSIAEWPRAQAIVLGNDPDFDFARLRAASWAVAAGAAFFAVNMDARFPIDEDTFEPGNGALAEAVAVASGVRPITVGKPHPLLFEVAISRLGCEPAEAAMVGDSLPSDIAGGRAAGMFTVWLHNSSAPAPPEADLKVASLPELHRLWRTRGSSPTDSPRLVR